jgi:hypothetical protein
MDFSLWLCRNNKVALYLSFVILLVGTIVVAMRLSLYHGICTQLGFFVMTSPKYRLRWVRELRAKLKLSRHGLSPWLFQTYHFRYTWGNAYMISWYYGEVTWVKFHFQEEWASICTFWACIEVKVPYLHTYYIYILPLNGREFNKNLGIDRTWYCYSRRNRWYEYLRI